MDKKPINCGNCANFGGFETTPSGRMKRDTLGTCAIAVEVAKEAQQYINELPPAVRVMTRVHIFRVGPHVKAAACRKFASKAKA